MNTTTGPTGRGWVWLLGAAVVGGALGWLAESTLTWVTIGAIVGLGTAVMTVVYAVRPLVAVPVGVGAGIGAYLGGTIVGVLCEPAGCPAFEAVAATTTGVGALVGIGLVVALATRSFDEYQESQQRGVAPPTSSCSPDESGDDAPDDGPPASD